MTSVTFPIALGGDGNSYSADGSAARDMRNGGHTTWFIPALQQLVIMADSAAASAAAAALGAATLTGTSTTSVAVGTGSKSFTASISRTWVVGGWLIAFRTSAVANYMLGRVTAYNSGTGALTLDVTGTGGSGTYTDWTITVAGPQGAAGAAYSVAEASKSSAYTMLAADKAATIRMTSTFTLSFTAIGTLGAGWWAYLINEGTGDVTLDPNAAETIDGLATYIMYPGEARLVWCNGSALLSIVVRPFARTWASSGTFTKPPGYLRFGRRVVGGGGGGGRSGSASYGTGGGGGGAGDESIDDASTYGTSETVTVGAAGAAQTGVGAGGTGGNSAVGTLAYAYGGGGGGGNGAATHYGGSGGGLRGAGTSGSASPTVTGGAGIATASAVNLTAGADVSASNPVSTTTPIHGGGAGGGGLAGGGSIYGGGGGGSGAASPLAAGTSLRAGSGGAGSNSGNGTAGSVPGGGGGGTRTGTTSGEGGRGQVDIWGVV